MVGDECGVDGDGPLPASEAARERGAKQVSKSSVECVAIDQLLGESCEDGVGIGRVAESCAGVGDGGDTCGGVGEDGEDDIERAGANRRPDAQQGCEEFASEVLDFGRGEGMLGSTHGWLRGSVAW